MDDQDVTAPQDDDQQEGTQVDGGKEQTDDGNVDDHDEDSAGAV